MNFIKATNEYTTNERSVPAPYIRRSFTLDFTPESATVRIATAGFYELYINGENITKGALAPYISNPDHFVCYDEYEIAHLLKKGKNAVGFILGNGFQNQTVETWDFAKAPYKAPVSGALLLRAFCEGEEFSLSSDESFKVHPSPIVYDIYRNGTHYDARLEIDGWCNAEFDDTGWDFATFATAPKGEIVPCTAEPIVKREEIKPVSIEYQENFCYYRTNILNGENDESTRTKGGYLYDFGKNTAGVIRLKIKGERGQTVTIRHGERLSSDGKFCIGGTYEQIIPLYQMDRYILKGEGDETYTPQFTYHGFRYAFVEGISEEQATMELLTYEVLSSDVKKRADFKCSDSTLNTLYDMAVNADLSNFHYFMTDCPHREKNGWTGDISASAEQAFMTFDCAESQRLWLRSARHAQTAEGQLPGIIPTSTWGYDWGNGPMWDSAIINLPYSAYKYDGRLDLFNENADMIRKYLEYISTRRDGCGLIACGLGDWCQPCGSDVTKIKAPLALTDTVTTYDTAKKAAMLFKLVGRDTDGEYAERLAESLKRSVREHLIDFETMTAAGNCQTSQVYLIAKGIFEPCEYERAYQRLIEIINADGRALMTGVIGLRYIFEVLALGGDIDTALELICREEEPSYKAMINRGATALCESLEDGTQNSSENHHFFGDIIRVFSFYVAGLNINPECRDAKEILFSPKIPSGMEYAEAKFMGVRVGWRRVGEKLHFYADIPEDFKGKFVYGDISEELKIGHNEFNI